MSGADCADLDGHNFEHVPLRRKGGGAPGLDLASERRRWGGVQGSCDAERGLPDAWRMVHGAENPCRAGAVA